MRGIALTIISPKLPGASKTWLLLDRDAAKANGCGLRGLLARLGTISRAWTGNMTMCRDGVFVERSLLVAQAGRYCGGGQAGKLGELGDVWRKQLEAVREVPHAGAKQAGIASAQRHYSYCALWQKACSVARPN